jgi:G3E family GTPase
VRSSPTGPIVVNVLTGFLGAGKTTLLNRLLREPDLSDVAVIINEFGSMGIDHLLVETIDDETVLLQSGCICCTIRGDLKQAILSLFEKRQAGRIAPFKRLVIETTGLADPAPIVATLTADLMLKYHFSMGNIIAVVDAPNGRHNLETYGESARQVAVADRIVVTKGDIAEWGLTEDLLALLAEMNPTARIGRGAALDRRRALSRSRACACRRCQRARLGALGLDHRRQAAVMGAVFDVAVDAGQPARQPVAAGKGHSRHRWLSDARCHSRRATHHPQADPSRHVAGWGERQRAGVDHRRRSWRSQTLVFGLRRGGARVEGLSERLAIPILKAAPGL